MKLNVVIVDDSLSDILAIERPVKKYAEELGCEVQVIRYTEPKSALRMDKYVGLENMLMFVDVLMPGLSGTELIPLMREMIDPKSLFVLMSSQHGFIKEGYAIEAFDFICKPPLEEDIKHVLKRAVNRFRAFRKDTFDFYADKTNYKVGFADILTISVHKNYATLITVSKRYCFRATVKQLLEKLPEQFIQISGNTLVNISRVTSISPTKVTLHNDNISLEISKTYFDQVLEAFRNYN
ncbi:MAG: response regulator transcription factor [Clostridia bacterium]|nr:response regulator transcription factor [Clostridia bacterium]